MSNTIIQPYFWPRFMVIEEFKHFRNGECIYETTNIPNIWHTEGQEFLLSVAFNTSNGISVPTNYYLGLDNRGTITVDDTLSSLVDEPTTNGYARQPITSNGGFTVGLVSGVMKASSGVISFVASGGSWGPCNNIFLCSSVNNSGHLIASSDMGTTAQPISGDSFTAKISLKLTV